MNRLTIVTAAWTASNLPKVIESIDSQTFQDFQHIIVNDNNPKVREIFKDMCDGKKRHWIDLGVRTHFYGALARNIGVIAAFSYIHHRQRDIENEWIVFHDDDNKWRPDHLQLMVDAVNANPEATMVASDAVWVGEHEKTWTEIRPCKIRHGAVDLGQLIYKTKLFREYGYFEPRPNRKHKYDIELIEKMVNGEGMDKVVFTHESSFIMNYRKR